MIKKYLNLLKNPKNSNVIIVSLIIVMLFFSIFLVESYFSYQSEIANAEVESKNLAEVIEKQISTSFQKIDINLQSFQDYFSNEESLTLANSQKYNKLLLLNKKRIPEVLSFKVTNNNGEFIGDDLGELSKSNLRDRDYFQKLKSDSINQLIISKPLISKTAKIWVIVLSRPILSKEGAFRGLILATISLEYFHQLFLSLDIGKEGLINLYGFDHFVYSRIPWSNELFGKSVNVASAVDQLISGKSTLVSYRAQSKIDGIDRIVSARKVSNFNFAVIVGLATKHVLYSWKIRTITYLIIMVILFISFTFFLINFLASLELVDEQRKQAVHTAKMSTLGEMASGIAHEINNPLTIISGTAKNLKRIKHGEVLDPKLEESLDKIIETSARIAKIIKSLLSFSRDSKNDTYIKTSIQKIFESTLELCLERIHNHGIELKLIPFKDQFIYCNEVQIIQVLMILLNNSLDALENSDVKWIEINVKDSIDRISIIISDSGKKIDDKIANKIMEPFFTTKAVGKGAGLGLSISQGIIETHGGRFYLDQSATFTSFVIEILKRN